MATLTETVNGYPVSIGSHAAVDTEFLIWGKPTVKFTPDKDGASAWVYLQLPQGFNMYQFDWTMEWCKHYVVDPYPRTSDVHWYGERTERGINFGVGASTDYQDQMFFMDQTRGDTTISKCRVGIHRSELIGQTVQFAIVYDHTLNRMWFYKDGQPVKIREGAGTGTVEINYHTPANIYNFSNIYKIYLGESGGEFTNTESYMGNWRVCAFKRFNGPYIPQAI